MGAPLPSRTCSKYRQKTRQQSHWSGQIYHSFWSSLQITKPCKAQDRAKTRSNTDESTLTLTRAKRTKTSVQLWISMSGRLTIQRSNNVFFCFSRMAAIQLCFLLGSTYNACRVQERFCSWDFHLRLDRFEVIQRYFLERWKIKWLHPLFSENDTLKNASMCHLKHVYDPSIHELFAKTFYSIDTRRTPSQKRHFVPFRHPIAMTIYPERERSIHAAPLRNDYYYFYPAACRER